MKKYLITLLIFTFLFISCASKSENYSSEYTYSEDNYDYTEESEILIPETTENFLGDFSPIQIDELMFLQKTRKTLKPKQINMVYLVPKTNSIEIKFREELNSIIISLNKIEREKILDVCKLFIEQYEAKTLPHHKVNSKTAYLNSKTPMWFGVLTATTECSKADYYMNCEFIEKRPYLLLKFIPTRCDDGTNFSPKFSLYMSPTQVKTFINQMDQNTLNAYVQELNEKAYTY